MEGFCIQGTVKNGQVVLEAPLDLPDGTVVTVEFDPDEEPRAQEIEGPVPPETRRAIMIGLTGRKDLANDPDWEKKLLKPRETAEVP